MSGGFPHQTMPPVTADGLTGPGLDGAESFMILGDLIIPVPADRETVIGRDNTACDIVIADPRVSKLHASVYRSGDRFFLKDLGSLNGTTVNGNRLVDAVPLGSGDTITLQPYTMVFADTSHARIQQMKQARSTAPSPGERGSHFAGQLNILSITDLIQLLNTTRQSGVLSVRYAGGPPASVSFHTGEILQARYRELTGEQAVYQILGLTEGEFEFVQGTAPIPDEPMHKPTLTLLLDGCRLLDESADRACPAEPPVDETSLLFERATLPLFHGAH